MRHLPLVLLLGLAPAFASASDCKFSAQRDFDVDAAGLRSVAFDLGSSDLRIEGVPGLAKVEVRARACASEQDWLASLTVDQQRSGDRLTIRPRSERDNRWSWFGSSYAYIELKVRVPASLAVATEGRSSDVDATGLASLDFSSSSGDLVARRIAGTVVTSASSGDIDGEDLGSMEVRRTGSGDVKLRNVRGDAKVERSGSGDLTFDQVSGNVEVGRVGSGDVGARRVQGSVRVEAIGSGDVDVSDVGGDFSVGSKGSGDVHHRDVRGKIAVPPERD